MGDHCRPEGDRRSAAPRCVQHHRRPEPGDLQAHQITTANAAMARRVARASHLAPRAAE